MISGNRLARRSKVALGTAVLVIGSVTVGAVPASAGPFGSLDFPGGSVGGSVDGSVGGTPEWVDSVTTDKKDLAPGVDLLTLKWGAKDAEDHWYVLVYLPSDPSGALNRAKLNLAPKATADRIAQALRDAGYEPRVDEVSTPAFTDVPAGELGWTVKVGSFGTSAEADETLAKLKKAGFTGQSRYSAQDGADSTAPQAGYVLRVDFRDYRGRLVSEHGPNLAEREDLTDLVTSTDALAGINAHWTYKEGLAGLYVKDGRALSSITDGRGGVLVRDGGRTVDVDRFSGHYWLTAGAETVEVDGLNRLPGHIQNCGGVGGDVPWSVAQHDRVCTDDSELVRFTAEWGAATPAGAGAEAVIDDAGRVVAVNAVRGTTAPAGGSTIQGTGASARWMLDNVRVGEVIGWREDIRDSSGNAVELTPDTTIMQVGPTLVDGGAISVDARADGLVWEGDDPSFTYKWLVRSNPRSTIGMDDKGRLLLAVFDGRQEGYAEGLSIQETAEVMKRLGATEALNLDGGGSSVIATPGGIVNSPSDAGHIQRPQNNGWLLTR